MNSISEKLQEKQKRPKVRTLYVFQKLLTSCSIENKFLIGKILKNKKMKPLL